MKRQNISMAKFEEMGKAMGFSAAPKEHPVYSEGYSINLLSRTPKPSGQKDIVSLPSDTPNALDSAMPSETTSNSD